MELKEAVKIVRENSYTDFGHDDALFYEYHCACNKIVKMVRDYGYEVVDPKETHECDCVSKQAVIDLIEHYNSDGLGSVFYGYEEGVKFADAVNKLPSVNPQKWIPVSECGYPKPEEEYTRFLTVDTKGEITIQEFLLSLDEEPQPYFTGWRNITAYMPLPTYKGVEE